MRHNFRRVHGGVDRDAAYPVSSSHLQLVGGSAEYTADVPRVLHLQHAADTAAGAAHRVDLPDHPDRDQGDQVGTDGRRRPVQLERRALGQLGECPTDCDVRLERWNAKETAAPFAEQKGLKPVITQEVIIIPAERNKRVCVARERLEREICWKAIMLLLLLLDGEYFKKTVFLLWIYLLI